MADREAQVHRSAVVEDGAQLAPGVRVGPLCHVGPQVKLGEDVELTGHVSVQGDTTVGARTRIYPFASIGNHPQDLKFHGEPVTLEIGTDCIIREGVTMNPGTEGGGSVTRIGSRCALLANAHVAHDCIIGNDVIMSNNVMLAGHCVVGDSVIFGGGSAVHQFCRIGHHAFIGGLSGIGADMIPYGTAVGNRAKLGGLNLIGMKRAGLERASIHAIRNLYKALFNGVKTVQESATELKERNDDPHVLDIIDFVLSAGDRSLLVPAQD